MTRALCCGKTVRQFACVALAVAVAFVAPLGLGSVGAAEEQKHFGAYPTVAPADVDGKSFDLVVVGGTPGGVAAAVRAAREGLTVLLVNHTKHLGGFMTSGAGGWEAPYDGLRSPIYAELRTGAAEYYAKTYGEGSPQHVASLPSQTSRAHIDRPKIEPRVCEMLLNRMVAAEPKITVLTNYYPAAAERDGSLLTHVVLSPMHGTTTIRVGGKIFCDAMYEGDLAAAAGVPCRIGRESRQEYGEPHAGIIYMSERKKASDQKGFPLDADQRRLNIRPNSHATKDVLPASTGEADDSVMAYNYRLILTNDPQNRVLVEKPAGYDVAIAKSAEGSGFVPNVPNKKIAWNGGRLIGPQNGYPGGDWETREKISQQYLQAMLMRLWYTQNDPSAPEADRRKFAGYGLARDEFPDNQHLPYEIYVREARRLVGRYVFKEQDNIPVEGTSRTPIHADSIAMTDWPVDSVACTNRNVKGSKDEGVFFLAEEARPAQVPYRSLLPQGVDNLLVPVALSASHVGWGSIRLEPVWVQTGEAAGLAAALSLKHNTTPGKLDADVLIRELCDRGSQVSFFNDVDSMDGSAVTKAVLYFGTKGFFASYDARPEDPLSPALAQAWIAGFRELQAGKLDPQALARRVADLERSTSGDAISVRAFYKLLPAQPAALPQTDAPLTRGEACRILFVLLRTIAKT